jgi:hypothetical protein
MHARKWIATEQIALNAKMSMQILGVGNIQKDERDLVYEQQYVSKVETKAKKQRLN